MDAEAAARNTHPRPRPTQLHDGDEMMDTLDSKGAAELLHVSEALVQSLARRGEIPGLQLGGHWLFIRQDLLDTIRQRAADEQRRRREETMAVSQLPKPNRSRGRPRKILIGEESGQNSGFTLQATDDAA